MSRDIDSVFGLCTILSKKREGATFLVHVEFVNDSSNRFGMLELRERGSFYYCKFYRSLDRLNLSNIPTKATPL